LRNFNTNLTSGIRGIEQSGGETGFLKRLKFDLVATCNEETKLANKGFI